MHGNHDDIMTRTTQRTSLLPTSKHRVSTDQEVGLHMMMMSARGTVFPSRRTKIGALLLKEELTGSVLVFAKQLPDAKLAGPGGVQYLLDILRPKYVKRNNTVFLWRLTELLDMKRGSLEFHD